MADRGLPVSKGPEGRLRWGRTDFGSSVETRDEVRSDLAILDIGS